VRKICLGSSFSWDSNSSIGKLNRSLGCLPLIKHLRFITGFVTVIVLSTNVSNASQIPVSASLTIANAPIQEGAGENSPILVESVPEPEPDPPPRPPRNKLNSRSDRDDMNGYRAVCRGTQSRMGSQSVAQELGRVLESLWTLKIPSAGKRGRTSKNPRRCGKPWE
jgi:hypothetical protein